LIENELSIDIEDRGAGCGNLSALKRAFDKTHNTPPSTDQERGRGIFLIRSLMDSSKFRCMKSGGVRITMFKINKP